MRHITTAHLVTDQVVILAKAEEGHVHEESFWCGFCCRVLRPELEKWMHIGRHFESGAVIEEYEFI